MNVDLARLSYSYVRECIHPSGREFIVRPVFNLSPEGKPIRSDIAFVALVDSDSREIDWIGAVTETKENRHHAARDLVSRYLATGQLEFDGVAVELRP